MSSSGSPAPEAGGCPACGLALPPYARFCARCGTPQPHPFGLPHRPAGRRFPTWLLAMLAGGAGLSLLVAVFYAGLAAQPGLAGISPAASDRVRLRLTSAALALVAAAFFGLQVVAVVGLARGRPWGRTAGTLACGVWALTCIGLPIALLGLSALWRAPAAEPRLPKP
jgi:hypothetical protein